ncbi:MAG: carboxypeptidase-like regulatory domain-containing protein [Flavobacterium micromati]|nr:carboxypeptidase-like regulatory domain-containing protein [Flavobacterium micromati]
MRKHILITLLLFYNTFFCQVVINGKIKSNDGKELQFVNIGIKNKNIGTIADENGIFSLKIDNSKTNEILTFSYVGFEELNLKIEDIINSKNKDFVLTQKTIDLSEVIIVATKATELKIGTKSYSSMVVGYVRANNDKINDIQEFAKEIKLKKPSKILNVNINLFNVNVDSTRFRINLYNIKDNLPFEKINNENIIVKQKVENGWNNFDLVEYNLTFDKPLFISIEYIPEKLDEKEPFRYSGQLFGESITRSSSLGTWNTKKGLTIAIYVTVKQ